MVLPAIFTTRADIGRFLLFNQSRYYRTWVEKVMGFCTEQEYTTFFTQVELFEEMLVDADFTILNLTWISVKQSRNKD